METSPPPVEPPAKIGKMTRRTFLRKLGVAAGGLAVPPIFRPEAGLSKETLWDLRAPNQHATMTNLSVIPKGITMPSGERNFWHNDKESLSLALNFNILYSKDDAKYTDHLNLEIQKGLWDGVKKALGNGQRVYLVLEFPPDDKKITIEDWKKYTGAIARNFKGAHFVVGNEINDDSRWSDDPDKYDAYSPGIADHYIEAARAIKKIAPSSKTLMYGEAHYGNGEILKKTLDRLKEVAPDDFGDIIDGLTFHFYDAAGNMDKRVALYQGIARQYGLNDKLYLTELGKAEAAKIDETQRCSVLTQNLATALSIVEEGKIEDAVWHTAFLIKDPNKHSLSEINPDGSISRLKPAFETFWEVSRLLHHDIRREEADGVTIIRGKTSQNEDTVIMWNNQQYLKEESWLDRLLQALGENSDYRRVTLDNEVRSIYLPRSTNEFIEGKPYIYIYNSKPEIVSEVP